MSKLAAGIINGVALTGFLTPPEDQEVFDSEFNHIDEALRKNLAPGTPPQEIVRMHGQLQKSAELFPSVLELCEHAANVRHLG